MAVDLSLLLLGGFQIKRGDTPITAFESNKVRALLAYLTVEARTGGARPHQRSTLAGLLWPDYPEETARTNLRHVLRQLRQTLPETTGSAPLLLTDQQTIRINPDCAYILDVAQFTHLLALARKCTHRTLADCPDCLARYHEAAQLYRGDFLAGFTLYDSELFDEWMVVRREEWHRQALELFFTLATHYEAQGDAEQALAYAWRQLQLEPWREEAHRQVMRMLVHSGKRSAALAQFNQCRKILADELGVEPDAETMALYEQIRSGKFDKMTPMQSIGQWQDDKLTISSPHPVIQSSLQDWGEAPTSAYFYGRQAEQAQLERWLLVDRCRLIAVLGMGGMGKTSLVTKAARANAEHFDVVIWRSLLNAPSFSEFLWPCLQFLSRQQLTHIPDTLNEQLTLLLAYFTQQRCLLVLDNVESILATEQAGHYRPGYEGYGQLIERIAQHNHQSCLVLTSREWPHSIGRLAEDLPTVRTLPLHGLSVEAGQALLKTRGLTGDGTEVTSLMQRYSGNPLALKLVARTIQDLFDGDLAAFLGDAALMTEGLIFDDIRMVLNQQFARLSSLERELLVWLAIEREAISLPALAQNLLWSPPRHDLLEALLALQRRSLLEKSEGGFTLQNVVTEYITDYLIEQVCQEIYDLRFLIYDLQASASDADLVNRKSKIVNLLLNRFALLKARAKGYVRQSQVRLTVQPIANHLLATLGKAGLVEQSTQILAALRKLAATGSAVRGYTGGNLLNLLLQLDVDLNGYNASQICVWQAYLRGRYTPGLNLADADLTGSAFTSIFGRIQVLHYHANGELLAVGSSEGMVRLWRVNDGSLLHTVATPMAYNYVYLRGDSQIGALVGAGNTLAVVDFVNAQVLYTFSSHRHEIWRIAFSGQGAWGASGDAGGQICLWAVERGQLLYRLDGHTKSISALVFAPGDAERDLLASADVSGMICLWELPTGKLLHRFQAHSEEVAVLQFALGGAILASGSHDYTVRLWDLRRADLSEPVQVLRRHTRPIRAMAVDPAGRILATGGVDTFITLWDIQSGQVLHALADHAASTHAVTFSLDGRQVAVLDANHTIGVWDAQSGKQVDSYRIYHGAIPTIATSPDGRLLLSGGAEQSLYLWDISTPTAARLISRLQGHRQRVESIAFSADGVTVASGDQAGAIRVWNIRTGSSRVLAGHAGVVGALAFHPDGRQLASAGVDARVCIWDVQTHEPPRVLRGHTNLVDCCAFSPDGMLLASGGMDRTVRVWNVASGELRHTLQQHTNMVQQVRFCPDGRRLVSSSFDQTCCLWDVTTGELLARWPTQNTVYLALAIHPNGKVMAAGGRDHITRLVTIDTGEVIEVLHGHRRNVEAVSFALTAADEAAGAARLLVTASHDETIKLWDISAVGTGRAAAVCLATLQTPGPYAGMNITGVTGISEAQKTALLALGAVEK